MIQWRPSSADQVIEDWVFGGVKRVRIGVVARDEQEVREWAYGKLGPGPGWWNRYYGFTPAYGKTIDGDPEVKPLL